MKSPNTLQMSFLFLAKMQIFQWAVIWSSVSHFRFELALQIGDLKVAYEIATEADVSLAIHACIFACYFVVVVVAYDDDHNNW